MKKSSLIPDLRFPEFVNDEEWEEKELGEICNITNGKANAQDHVANAKYPLFDRSEVIKASDQFIFDCEAVIIPGEGMRFIPKYYKGKFNLHQRAYALKDFLCNGKFVYYSMLHRNILISQKAVQSTVLSLRLPILQNFPIEIPKPKEQQKIAACLSSLDNLIEAHNQKLGALNDHKKGLMQKLFPEKGEKVPKYRFPEFENYGEWIEAKLGDKEVAYFVNSKIDSEQLTVNNYISTNNMQPDYSGITKASKLPTIGRVTEFNVGDILISNIRPYLKKVWKANIKGGASNDVLVFRSGSRVKSDFLEFILKNDSFINYVMESAKGVKMPRGDKDAMLKYSIKIPQPIEQQKIASTLSVLDELIFAEKEEVEQLKAHKKGLMQSLFPNNES